MPPGDDHSRAAGCLLSVQCEKMQHAFADPANDPAAACTKVRAMTEPNTQQPHAPSSLAADEALEYTRRAEILATELDRLHRETPHERAAIGYANQHLGLNLKLAEVHATLAVRDAVLELLDALRPTPAPAAVFTAAPPETPDNSAGVFAECSVCNGHLYLTSVARSGAVYACDGRGHDRFTRADLGLNAVEQYDHTGHLALFILTDPEQLEVAAK